MRRFKDLGLPANGTEEVENYNINQANRAEEGGGEEVKMSESRQEEQNSQEGGEREQSANHERNMWRMMMEDK